EAYIQFNPEAYGENGEVKDEELKKILSDFMQEFRDHIERVLTVLHRGRGDRPPAPHRSLSAMQGATSRHHRSPGEAGRCPKTSTNVAAAALAMPLQNSSANSMLP